MIVYDKKFHFSDRDNTRGPEAPKAKVVIIAGPTASGKSALALQLAKSIKGNILNADSMQLYKDLCILTARPSKQDETQIPHCLYGVLSAHETGNVAWWCRQALNNIQAILAQGKIPILCGGTGLYYEGFIHGLSPIPAIRQEARQAARCTLKEKGTPVLYEMLSDIDPVATKQLNVSDSQRLVRAWEIWLSTGKPLSYWQSRLPLNIAPYDFVTIRLDPDRKVLRKIIADRFHAMLKMGVVEEVRNLLALKVPKDKPIMKAHGVRELGLYLQGEIALSEAVERVIIATSQYTKRQATWFNHHQLCRHADDLLHISGNTFEVEYIKSVLPRIISFISSRLDIAGLASIG